MTGHGRSRPSLPSIRSASALGTATHSKTCRIASWFSSFHWRRLHTWNIFCLLSCVGSPADKADLEIGDEILEVNGKSLDGATHTEVISHIHQVLILLSIQQKKKKSFSRIVCYFKFYIFRKFEWSTIIVWLTKKYFLFVFFIFWLICLFIFCGFIDMTQCIRSRTICLRVKRKSGNKLGEFSSVKRKAFELCCMLAEVGATSIYTRRRIGTASCRASSLLSHLVTPNSIKKNLLFGLL